MQREKNVNRGTDKSITRISVRETFVLPWKRVSLAWSPEG
jgi:hypothetical protein